MPDTSVSSKKFRQSEELFSMDMLFLEDLPRLDKEIQDFESGKVLIKTDLFIKK
ncbi:MAG: hypothetical protein JSS09_00490 [Verrucomicrobia bacterium]|nr:hypothetical protein [Verrucomicrobiota bacterium]